MYPSLFLSIKPGIMEWAYVLVQMKRRMTRRRDWRLNIAVYRKRSRMVSLTALGGKGEESRQREGEKRHTILRCVKGYLCSMSVESYTLSEV
jgi:hypothetical protein